ncbi:MAG TPA: 2-succinyl-6-hydroxy-2,4-cyclohexadiene-1-carboxylate synthase [Chloroflexota bacterium]|nr:2-succinyl-6-hydroxy-2,4-cyclohexadiene-1-carboxylate synthase [Chloroflexota bacterium]
MILLHGFLGSSTTWDDLTERLAHSYRCLALDLPGHGGSPLPSDAGSYSMTDLASAVATRLEQLDIGRAAMLGYSMGGRLALHVALKRPGLVRVLITESTSPGIEAWDERLSRLRQDEMLATKILHEGMEPFVDYWERLPLFHSQTRMEPVGRAAIRNVRLSTSAEGAAWSISRLSPGRHEPLFTQLKDLRMPWLIIAGELDHRYRSMAQKMERASSNARAVIIPGAGHAVHLERPEAFALEVARFLEQHPI